VIAYWVVIAVSLGLASFLAQPAAPGMPAPRVEWRPAEPRAGDVVAVEVGSEGLVLTPTGDLGGRPLAFFSQGDRQVAVAGVDVDAKPGAHPWRIAIQRSGQPPETLTGHIVVAPRHFSIQNLTLPKAMVDLDPATERRALAETERLRAVYRTLSPARLWQGRFMRPIGGEESGSGFGSRRIINGQPRAPHTGVDYSAPTGTPVLAANAGRVALVGEFFFPGRLVVLDHGLGLHTLYFHLDRISSREGQAVARGQVIGTVGATGRATGPHLHFGAQIGEARVDPEVLLALDLE
jgi:murein DD-endopeptidase MepM/ murein hydrolase activator NlpD